MFGEITDGESSRSRSEHVRAVRLRAILGVHPEKFYARLGGAKWQPIDSQQGHNWRVAC